MRLRRALLPREVDLGLAQLDAVQQAVAFRPGHAYCHRCESVACEHSRPGSSRQVFVGYTPTGLPRWEDFAQQCLERKHPQVDRLYDDPPSSRMPSWVLLVPPRPGSEMVTLSMVHRVQPSSTIPSSSGLA